MTVSSQDNQSRDYLAEIAIVEGKRQAAELDQELEIVLEFTDEQLKMLGRLSSALALSVKVLLDTAISYVYFNRKDEEVIKRLVEYNNQNQNASDEIDEQTKNSARYRIEHTKKLPLTAVLSHKLEELGMKDKINECAVTGIYLLYERLISNKQKPSQS